MAERSRQVSMQRAPTPNPVGGASSPAEGIPPAAAARAFAALVVAYGVLTDLLQLPMALPTERYRLAILGSATLILGLLLWVLPRAARSASSLWKLPPVLLLLIALHAGLGHGIVYPHVFSLLAFVWMGLALPRWTALRQTPFLVLSLGVPILASGEASALRLASALPVLLTCVGTGEILAALSERAFAAQSSLRRTRELLRHREAQYRSLVQNSSDLITVVDPEGEIRYQTAAVGRVFGYETTELVGHQLEKWVHPDDAMQVQAFLRHVRLEPEATPAVECRFLHRDGSWRHCATTAVNLVQNPHVAGIVLSTRDISERKALEEELSHQAFHDPLTGLANRAFFVNRVQQALAEGQRVGAPLAVLFLDLDGFKTVNDSLGHTAGDELLVSAAHRLSMDLRPGDTAARLGGDEFAVLVQNVLQPNDAISVAERLLDALRAPFQVHGKEVIVRASVGIALGTSFTEDADDLLRNADVAMYAAKGNGKNGYALFQPQMHTDVVERLTLQTDLHRAFDREEFTIYYQPIVDLPTGRIAGMEALLRWNHPERGLLHPSSFLAMAEETGLIDPLGRWVLRQACQQVRSWQALRRGEAPLVLSVNLSASQLRQPQFGHEVARVLDETGLPPQDLILEIIESVLLDDSETTREAIATVRSLGVRLALDDFGTGYSSLAYIRRFGIELLKVDRSFLQSIGTELEDPALTQAVVQLAKSLGLETIAEGVENAAQLEFLRQLACDFGQGYYFAGPMHAEAMDALLVRHSDQQGEWVTESAQRGPGALWEEGGETRPSRDLALPATRQASPRAPLEATPAANGREPAPAAPAREPAPAASGRADPLLDLGRLSLLPLGS